MRIYDDMLIYNDRYHWEGWGGAMRLASGSCWLRLFDLKRQNSAGLAHIRPIVVIVSDVPESGMSIKSCAGHIATQLSSAFQFDSHRMLYLEYYPETDYGGPEKKIIPERYEAVEFAWHGDKAIAPRWRILK